MENLKKLGLAELIQFLATASLLGSFAGEARSARSWASALGIRRRTKRGRALRAIRTKLRTTWDTRRQTRQTWGQSGTSRGT